VSDKDRMQQEQIAAIGARYLQRTLAELPRLRELCAHIESDASAAAPGGVLQEIERMTHKIYGSGAMFGFEAISERAREAELLALDRITDVQSLTRLRDCIAALDAEVREAGRLRGIQ
jgi:HPt (histidine-containing phosphotransfer) domain-containing protein